MEIGTFSFIFFLSENMISSILKVRYKLRKILILTISLLICSTLHSQDSDRRVMDNLIGKFINGIWRFAEHCSSSENCEDKDDDNKVVFVFRSPDRVKLIDGNNSEWAKYKIQNSKIIIYSDTSDKSLEFKVHSITKNEMVFNIKDGEDFVKFSKVEVNFPINIKLTEDLIAGKWIPTGEKCNEYGLCKAINRDSVFWLEFLKGGKMIVVDDSKNSVGEYSISEDRNAITIIRSDGDRLSLDIISFDKKNLYIGKIDRDIVKFEKYE